MRVADGESIIEVLRFGQTVQCHVHSVGVSTHSSDRLVFRGAGVSLRDAAPGSSAITRKRVSAAVCSAPPVHPDRRCGPAG
jgi:hypothetical protein